VPRDGRQPRALEDADVFRDGRQRHVEAAGELADGVFAGREAREDFASRGIREGEERVVERVCVMVNHLVYYAMNRAVRQ
jgi:hypothetical protein